MKSRSSYWTNTLKHCCGVRNRIGITGPSSTAAHTAAHTAAGATKQEAAEEETQQVVQGAETDTDVG